VSTSPCDNILQRYKCWYFLEEFYNFLKFILYIKMDVGQSVCITNRRKNYWTVLNKHCNGR